jgi:hypothetical protein
MTDTKTTLEPPASIADVDKRLRKLFLTQGLAMSFALVVIPIVLIVSQVALARRFPMMFGGMPTPGDNGKRIFTSPASVILDVASAGLIMGIFWGGISSIHKSLLGFGRHFLAEKRYADAAEVLTSLNQQGQHFLDQTGEAHYLISIALDKTGKPETAKKARDFVLKNRAQSEYAEMIRKDSHVRTAGLPSSRSDNGRPKVTSAKKRRF